MTKKEFIEDLQKKGSTEEQILQALIKGDKAKGVNPINAAEGAKDKEASKKMFAKMLYKRYTGKKIK